jgi:hypothetical protein
MNSVRHPEFIFSMISLLKPQSYLELGLYMGETFEKVCPIVYDCVGVDIKDVRENKNVGQFYQMTTTAFFSINKKTFDVIFIDADHSYENVLSDLKNSLTVLNSFGTIFLHDTDPIDQSYHACGYCGDAYKVIDNMYELGLDAITFPISNEGVTVVRRKEDRRVLACLKK